MSMPPHGTSLAARAQQALGRIDTQGGATRLPAVLKSVDVIPFMSKGWFQDALRLRQMPGMQMRPGGVWRCDRETFMAWLHQLAATER